MRISSSAAALGLLLVLTLVSAQSAQAAYMDCLEKAKGRTIVWDSSWDSDNRDNGTRYKITDVSIYNRLPDRSVTLTMRAEGSHARRNRSYKVVTEEKARAFCEHLVEEVRTLRLPDMSPIDVAPTEETPAGDPSAEGLPFIRFSGKGWVRDFAPTGASLVACRVLDTRFSCLRQEKERYGATLRELEEELRWRIRK